MENLPKDHALKTGTYQAVVVGVSAGGMEALKTLLGIIEADFSPALIIVQHMHPLQDDFLVEHLKGTCRLPVKEAEEKEPIHGGVVYLAPANYHLLVEVDRSFSLSTEEKVNFSRPSIDVLFETAADAYGAGLIGIVLTGANKDGAAGLRRIKEKAGMAIVQDPQSAAYPAMPAAALAATSVDHVLTLDAIGRLLCELGGPGRQRPVRSESGDHGENSHC